ncbi:MAG TPA: hypothetical protein VKA68_00365 [bacterium]|nr:hypothetical protein [bacterium]
MGIAPNYSEQTILSVGSVTLFVARDHQPALEDGGLSGHRIDQMERDIEELEAAPTEEANKLTLRGFTESKNEALDQCYLWGRKFEQKIEDIYGKHSAEAGMFPRDQFADAVDSEDEMLVVMPTLLDLLEQLEEGLAQNGELEEFKSEGSAALETLQNRELTQELYKVEKGEQARHRQVLRRRIYDTVNDINKTGRRVYRNDPEKRDLFRSRWPYKKRSSESSQSEASGPDAPEDDADDR